MSVNPDSISKFFTPLYIQDLTTAYGRQQVTIYEGQLVNADAVARVRHTWTILGYLNQFDVTCCGKTFWGGDQKQCTVLKTHMEAHPDQLKDTEIKKITPSEQSTLFRNLTALGDYAPQAVRTTIDQLQEERVKAALTADATFAQYVTGVKPTVNTMDDLYEILFIRVDKSNLPQWKKLVHDNPILKRYEPIVALLETYYELKDYPHVKKGGHLDPIDGAGRRWIFHSPCHDSNDADTFVRTAVGTNCDRIINLSGKTLNIPAQATKQPQVTPFDFTLTEIKTIRGHIETVKEGGIVMLSCKDGVNDTATYFVLFNVLGWVQKKTPDTVIVSAYGDYLTHLVKNAPLPIAKPDELRLPTLDTLKEMCRPEFLAKLKG